MDPDESLNQFEEQRIEIRKKSAKILPFFLILPLVFFATLYSIQNIHFSIFSTIISAFMIFVWYNYKINIPFKKIKTDLRTKLLTTYMQTYHPDIDYKYFPEKANVKKIIKSSKLIKADKYEEEDVIIGNQNDIEFYISEIKLKRKSNKSEYTVFKGMMFKLKIPGKNFPLSQIQSKPGLIKKYINKIEKNEEFGFYFDSVDKSKFKQEMSSLFPFIRHLMQKNKDIRINVEKDEMVLLLESDIKFLDDPKPSVHVTLHKKNYYAHMAKQLNSFLFIVESIAGGLDALELEEKLKLNLVSLLEKK